MMDRPELKMILKDLTFEKLQSSLKDVDTPIRIDYIEYTNAIQLPELIMTQEFENNFRIILDSLLREKAVRYTNGDDLNLLCEEELAFPVRIEYSMRDKKFRLLMYSIKYKRPREANIDTMRNLRIDEGELEINYETASRILHEQKYCEEPIVMEIKGAMWVSNKIIRRY